jgi:GNAT superfamily N-acetyltransferase
VLERERRPVPAGAFVLYVHARNRHPYLNYAIPAAGATSGDGAALVAAARERGLVPRLEYIEPCFPWVEGALAPAGFVRESRLRVMTITPESLREPSASAKLATVRPGSPLVRPTLSATQAAFGEPGPSDEDVAAWKGRAVAALVDGEVVGGAGWTTVIDAVTEIVGVGVRESFRGRGIGAALTAAATRGAFAEGVALAFLTPGDDTTARVYERAGFEDSGWMLHLRRPE